MLRIPALAVEGINWCVWFAKRRKGYGWPCDSQRMLVVRMPACRFRAAGNAV